MKKKSKDQVFVTPA